jgi:zinc protease
VYAVQSSFDVGKTRALYKVEFGCDPPNVSKARAIIERNLTGHADQAGDAGRIAAGQRRNGCARIPLSESSTGDIAAKLLSLRHA